METFTDPSINGPWDMTSFEDEGGAHLFVTNVLNGTVAANGGVVNQGTVLRIDLAASQTQNATDPIHHRGWLRVFRTHGLRGIGHWPDGRWA